MKDLKAEIEKILYEHIENVEIHDAGNDNYHVKELGRDKAKEEIKALVKQVALEVIGPNIQISQNWEGWSEKQKNKAVQYRTGWLHAQKQQRQHLVELLK